MIVNYNCKFCRQPGNVEIEDNPDIELQVEKWQAMLSCNRCADYRTAKRGLEEKISRVIRILLLDLQTRHSVTDEHKVSVRAALIAITKKWTTLVCNHYEVTNQWDEGFVTELMDSPELYFKVLSVFVRQITHSNPTLV